MTTPDATREPAPAPAGMLADAERALKLCEHATEGPWATEPHGDTTALYSGRDSQHHGLRLLNLDDGDGNFDFNLEFIAASRELVPLLANHVKALLGLLDTDEAAHDMDRRKFDKQVARADAAGDERDALRARVAELEAALNGLRDKATDSLKGGSAGAWELRRNALREAIATAALLASPEAPQ